ncbi:hypothetical protein [Halomonas halocynthiae]|uniref:hypothetical protein n=1 Tax=Halomonas halocynthiae TaxID=176290 RepID=UPI0004859E24|nr:hypothetical protein [Halomonas halocynthiae]
MNKDKRQWERLEIGFSTASLGEYMKISFQKLISLIIITILVTGCTSVSAKQSGSRPIDELSITVDFFNPDKDKMHHPGVKEIYIYFTAISGQIFGPRGNDVIYSDQVTQNQLLSLDMNAMTTSLDNHASKIVDSETTKGLLIKPNSTRFFRVGTDAYDPLVNYSLGLTGFYDSKSSKSLILTYFDQPCEITGTVNSGGISYVHKIKIPSQGFHWVMAEFTNPNTTELSVYKNTENISFAITAQN